MKTAGLYSGTVLVLGIVAFIESLAFSIPVSYFPNYAMSLGASVASIGIFTSSFMAASTLMSPKLGGLSDKLGRKRVILWGLLGDVIFGALTGLVPSWLWLLLVRTINGAVTAAATLPAEALLVDNAPPDRWGEAAGFVASCAMLGRNVGPAFGGATQFAALQFVSLEDSYRIPYFVDAGLAVLAMVLVAWKIKDKPIGEIGSRIKAETSIGRSSRTERNFQPETTRSFKILLLTAFTNGLSLGFIIPVMALFFQDKFGLEPIEIGSIMSISGLVGITVSWIAGRASDRFGRRPLIALGGLSSRLGGLVLPLTADPAQATLVLSARSLAFNMYMPSMRALLADLTPEESRGRLFGLYNSFFTAGDIAGPVIATYLYDLFRFYSWKLGGLTLPGYGVPFYVNSLIGIASIIILLAFVKETVKMKSRIRMTRSNDLRTLE